MNGVHGPDHTPRLVGNPLGKILSRMFHDARKNRIFVYVHDNPICILCRQVGRKKKLWTCSIVGLSSGSVAQQRVMRSHKAFEIGFGPSGRGGLSFLPITAWRTAASLRRWGNGRFSVMHSSISIPNEYVSEAIVGTVSPSKSSGAEYLTGFPVPVPVAVVDMLPSTSSDILAIPKSQICGSPLVLCGQPYSRRWT